MPSAARRLGVFGVSWKSGPDQPSGRLPVAFSTASIEARIYCRSSSSDMPIWMMRRRETVRDELGIALLALLDEERVVVGNGLIERKGGLDAVLVQGGEDAKDPDTVAVLVVAIAADVGKVRWVSGPHALWAPQRAHRQRRTRRHLPVPMLEVDDDDEGDTGVVRPSENGARDNRGPGIKVLVHAVGSFCGHRSTPPAFVLNDRVSDYDIRGDRRKFGAEPLVIARLRAGTGIRLKAARRENHAGWCRGSRG